MNNPKFLLVCLVALICNVSHTANCAESMRQTPQKIETDQSIHTPIMAILKAFATQDTALLNNYIDKNRGIVVLYRPGAIDRYTTIDKIDFKGPLLNYLYYPQFDSEGIDNFITYGVIPHFDCEGDGEPDMPTGIYCSKLGQDTTLTRIVDMTDAYISEIDEDEKNKLTELERISYRITYIAPNENVLAFYLTPVGKEWYITVLDFVCDDCSA